MKEEALSSYIGKSDAFDPQITYQVVAICGAVMLLILVCILLVSFITRKKRERALNKVLRDKEYRSMTELEKSEFSKRCINPSETPLSVIGNRGLKQFLTDEEEVEGFSVITNRRVYFKGKCFRKNGKGKLEALKENRTYDNFEIKKVELVTERPLWPIVTAAVFALLEMGVIIFFLASMILGKI